MMDLSCKYLNLVELGNVGCQTIFHGSSDNYFVTKALKLSWDPVNRINAGFNSKETIM